MLRTAPLLPPLRRSTVAYVTVSPPIPLGARTIEAKRPHDQLQSRQERFDAIECHS